MHTPPPQYCHRDRPHGRRHLLAFVVSFSWILALHALLQFSLSGGGLPAYLALGVALYCPVSLNANRKYPHLLFGSIAIIYASVLLGFFGPSQSGLRVATIACTIAYTTLVLLSPLKEHFWLTAAEVGVCATVFGLLWISISPSNPSWLEGVLYYNGGAAFAGTGICWSVASHERMWSWLIR